MNEVTLEINVDSKSAQKELDKFGKGASQAIQGVENSVGGLGGSFKGVASQVSGLGSALKAPFIPVLGAIGAVVSAFSLLSSGIAAAAEESKLLRQIDASLRATGEGGKAAVAAISEFADEVKKATAIDDDLVKQLFVTAKSFGVTTEQAKKMTAAAIDLAAATGIDVDTALRQLGGTFDGTIGKIGNLGSEFRNLSTDQLKNGAALDLVSQKYGGTAAKDLDTYAGATGRLSNALGDLSKTFGRLATGDDASRLASATASTIEGVNSLLDSFVKISTNQDQRTLDAIAKDAKKTVEQIELIGNKSSAAAPKVGELIASLEGNRQSSKDRFQTFGQQIDQMTTAVVDSTKLTGKAAEDARNKFEELAKTVENAGLSELQVAETVKNKRLAGLADLLSKEVITQKESNETKKKILEDYNKAYEKSLKDLEIQDKNSSEKRAVDAEKAAEKAAEAYKGSFDKIKSGLGTLRLESDSQNKNILELIDLEKERGDLIVSNAKQELDILGKSNAQTEAIIAAYERATQAKKEFSRENIALATTPIVEVGLAVQNIGKNLAKTFTDIPQKLKNITFGDVGAAIVGAFKQGASFISGDLFKGGFDIARVFAELPKNLLNIFSEFSTVLTDILDKLPETLENFFEKLPQLASSIANKLGTVLESIFQKLPQIVQSLLSALGPLISALFEKIIPGFIRALPGIVENIAKALPGLIETILKALPTIITEIFKAIPQIIKSLVDAIPDIIEVLAENIDEIVLAFVEGIISAMGEIVAALVDSLLVDGGLERIVGAILRAIPRIVVALVQGVARGLVNAAESIGGSLGRAFIGAIQNIGSFLHFDALVSDVEGLFAGFFETLVSGLTNIGPSILSAVQGIFSGIFGPILAAFEPLINALNALKDATDRAGSLGGKGGGDGVIAEGAGRLGKALGFSQGGMVYAANGFVARGTDTVPAMLTPGELVVPTDLVGQLASFLAGQTSQGGNVSTDTAILTAILQALQQPMVVQAEAKVNQSAFADIILQLNRQNSRLVA